MHYNDKNDPQVSPRMWSIEERSDELEEHADKQFVEVVDGVGEPALTRLMNRSNLFSVASLSTANVLERKSSAKRDSLARL
mmetsp:Transcript_21719/g.60673  ORF Transcript_21719/g.60673 Transcript_21719/m.60673 type:complete len:81 (-) Transcript_21719:177-419(-)|eukprot:CAMPEP_0117550338 /NCGR_PEP_ID=MMETSP0784-20121206/48629_1 /TAXON_ID=39447 /ORGANISM="" /LENGTH=80 /DNA_ID=CAMNT_0005347353 /DNA_START=85 /DNA_END=327 /DNA_ORIENTATION=-